MNQLQRRITTITYRALYWARYSVAPGVRSLLGVLLMIGGVFGFLPVLGFWMFPLGVGFVALDLPMARHRMERWMQRLALEAELAALAAPAPAPGESGDQPTSSQ
ncbi:MAG: hypothetical protein RIC56_14550 [Pseudomonadales bacterium]